MMHDSGTRVSLGRVDSKRFTLGGGEVKNGVREVILQSLVGGACEYIWMY